MRTLDRVLWSDLQSHWRQSLAISVLLACGIALFVMMTSAMRSLESCRDRFYRDYRFADLFVGLTRAPRHVVPRLEAVDGVAQAQPRVVRPVLLDIPSMAEPATCRLCSIEDDPSSELNRICLRRGRLPVLNGRNEVVAAEPFAEAHGLRPGDTLSVNMDGRQENLRIVGIALSPEYIYAVQPGLLLTDNRRFGILWMPRKQMEAAFNMEGAFNDLSIELLPKASLAQVVFEVDRLLESYGGRGAYSRDDQESHQRVSDEMHQMRSMAYVTPAIFLAVAAFLFNIVFSKLVQQQKEQIAGLRAFGYSRFELVIYYLKFMSLLVLLGSGLGVAIGWRLSWWMIDMYGVFFRFPSMEYQLATREAAIAVLAGCTAAGLGGWAALTKVFRLQPAEAMRPEAPQQYGKLILDRAGLGSGLPPVHRMILRRLEAHPTSTCLSVLGIAMGVAVLVLGTFMRDTIDFVYDVQFGRSQRQDVMLSFRENLSPDARNDAAHLPGVSRVEPFRSLAVRLRHGSRHERLGLMGLDEMPYLFRVLDERQRPIRLEERPGLTITEKLAEKLGVGLDDELTVEVLEGERRSYKVRVAAIFANYTDPAAYMHRMELHRLMRESERLSGVFLSVDSERLPDFYRAVKETPAVAAMLDSRSARKNFRDLITQNTSVMRIMNAIFGSIIAFGVIYNAALIALSESGRDLATLRVIGFSRWEVSKILIGELAALTLLAIPIGLPIGGGFAYLATLALDTESHRFPWVVSRYTLAYSTVVIGLAATVSALAVRRMSDRLDLIAVLKVKTS